MINKIYKSVIITGAADGIGLETLKRLLKEKVTIYALDKNISKLKKIQKKSNFKIIELDLKNTDKIYEVLSKLKHSLKDISLPELLATLHFYGVLSVCTRGL